MKTDNPALGNDTGLTFPKGEHPHDKLMTAISILQMVTLAEDSNSDGKGMWGNYYMPASCLEIAVKLMIDVLEHVEAPLMAEVKA